MYVHVYMIFLKTSQISYTGIYDYLHTYLYFIIYIIYAYKYGSKVKSCFKKAITSSAAFI